jgi:hypothetical protein
MKKFYAVLLVLLTTCVGQLYALSKGGFFRVDNVMYQVTSLDNMTVSVYRVDPGVTGTLTIPATVKDQTGNDLIVTGLAKGCILNTQITKIVLPSTLLDDTKAGGFQYGSLACPTLKEIALDGNTDFKVVDGVLFNANGHRLEAYPANRPGPAYTLPSDLVAVMPFAFAEAQNLETLTIPTGYFGQYNDEGNAFKGCWAYISSLKNYVVEEGNKYYSVRNGVLYKKGKKTALVSYPANRTDKTFTVDNDNDIVTVEPYAFSGVSALEEINFSNIQYWLQPVIMNCKNIKTITGTNSQFLKFKDNAVFSEAYELYYTLSAGGGTYTVPDYITKLKPYSFSFSDFDKVVIGANCGISDHAFYNSNVKEVDLSNYANTIWDNTFAGSKLEKVELPATVEKVATSAFQGCNNLKSVTFADGSTASSIDKNAFADDPLLETVNFGQDTQLSSIGNGAFALCPRLKSLSIPASITDLGQGIACGDTNLAYFDLSNTEIDITGVDRSSEMFDGLDAHTLVFLPQTMDEASTVAGDNIVNIDGDGNRTAESISLYNQATSFETPYPFTAKKVTYDRSFTKDTYATVAFPFALNASQVAALGKMYSFQNVSNNEAVFENSASSTTTAYQPYLLLSNGTAFSAENVKFEKASENSASGDFAACFEATSESGKLGLNSDFSATKAPVFRTLADGETILPFHAYITSSAASLPVKGAEATSISNIRVSGKASNSVYTLNGSELSTMPTQPGIYIIGKKKVLVK